MQRPVREVENMLDPLGACVREHAALRLKRKPRARMRPRPGYVKTKGGKTLSRCLEARTCGSMVDEHRC